MNAICLPGRSLLSARLAISAMYDQFNMRKIAANRVIATMVTLKTARNWAIDLLPKPSIRKVFAIPPRKLRAIYVRYIASPLKAWRSIVEASSAVFNLGEESLHRIHMDRIPTWAA